MEATPSLQFWKALINSVVPLYKAIYHSRGSPTKFDKICNIWLESHTTIATLVTEKLENICYDRILLVLSS